MSTMTAQREKAIYDGYRGALRAFRRAANGRDCRAGERRQRARAVVCGRYKVSHAVVKDVVKRFDLTHGVTQEHTPEYLRVLDLERAQQEFDATPHPCDCGSTEAVRPRYRALQAEVYGEYVIKVACFACWYEDYLDI